MKLLEEEGVAFERVNYFVDPLDEATLRRILAMGGLAPGDVLRKRDPAYRELDLAEADEETVIQALVAHPGLLQRPIIVRGDRAVLGRPIERVRELLEV